MQKHKNLLEIPNINSKDAQFKKIIYNADNFFLSNDRTLKDEFENLCICSGGTTSSCAKNGLITLDLRKEYKNICFDQRS